MIKEFVTAAYNTLLHNQNQFASGGILLMMLGAVGATFRKIPAKIWSWLVHQFTVSLTVNDDNAEFKRLKWWMQKQNIMKKSRHIDVATGGRWRTDEYNTVITPAPGHHWMFYKGRPISVNVSRIDDTKGEERREAVIFTTFGRRQKFLRQIIEDADSAWRISRSSRAQLFVWDGTNAWMEIEGYKPRPLDTVFFSGNIKKELINDINVFKSSEEWYGKMGIPYHRGYLFEGPPGTGKTSLVVGLSSFYNAKVYVLKISEMNDASLRKAITEAEANSFIIMEDADCMASASKREENDTEEAKAQKKKKDEQLSNLFGVTLSGLLNVLDGLLAPAGVMYFMTTNHIEKLDPALIRPGRIDVIKHIGMADESQKTSLYKSFFPNEQIAPEYIEKSMTMAELQQILLEKRNQLAEVEPAMASEKPESEKKDVTQLKTAWKLVKKTRGSSSWKKVLW